MEKIFMLTIDGTSSGDYENSAFSILFKTKEEAENYVDTDFITQVLNANIVEEDCGADAIAVAIENTCVWHDENNASFKFGGARTDYKIEETSIPS